MKKSTLIKIIVVIVALSFSSGCVYYNTFYNARKAFNEAESTRKKTQYRQRGRSSVGLYNTAIEKSLKVVDNYPNSKWYDDALYVLGVSYFYTEEYNKAERRFRELIINYPESKYAKESKVYLAKSKLRLNEEDEAMELFVGIFNSDFDKSYKSEAAMELGTFYYNNVNYDDAMPYFQAVRDSLGSSEEKRVAQIYIADGYYNMFQFKDALGAYLQISGMEPDNEERYHSYYQAALCSFNLMKINDAMGYLQTLIADDIYFDSLGALRLAVANGYEYEDEIAMAEEMYTQVANEEKIKRIAAMANYRLGLINQFDYDNLIDAKKYYDKTVELSRNTDFGKDALQRSSDIGKLETFSRKLIVDSSTTQANIDEAAITQFQLAELYWFSLNKPDTAMMEMQYIIDSFPSAFDAPLAYISLSEMVREFKSDTTAADSILYLMIERYPRSDYVREALGILNLQNTPADTGYAKVYILKAENFLMDEENVDSARYYYNYVVENFPESEFYLQARFALIWITEIYESPGDSSLVFAYQEIIDSFPETSWAQESRWRLKSRPEKTDDNIDTTAFGDTLIAVEVESPEGDSTTIAYLDPLEAVYFDKENNRIELLNLQPTETRKLFEYPTEAYRLAWEGDLYFQILLDFSGEVIDYVLKIKSDSEELNREAEETIASMIFDPLRIPAQLQGQWMVYKYRVRLPEHLR